LVGVVPDVPPAKPIKLPTVDERRLDNGLRLVAARRPGVPRVEARLLVPSARGGRAADAAQAVVMAKTLLSGTAGRTSMQIAQEQQRIGGHLDAHADSDDVVIAGSALATELPAFLALLADVVTGATHPDDEVMVERDVLAEEITLALSQPSTVAQEALVARLFGDHPYGRGQPAPDAVRAVKPGQLRKLQDKRLRPEGATLVLVGDFMPARALDGAEAALAGWATGGAKPGLTAPRFLAPGPTLLVDRPGAVQTNVRIAGPAVTRTHPDYPKLALANLVFGGYFISRLVDNIRERRGYTYSPGSGVSQRRTAGYFSVQADVGTGVTGPALVEMRYELARMLAGPIDEQELLAAKRYLAGSLSMSVQTQAGLAAYLGSLVTRGLTIDYLREFPATVARLTEADVIDAARTYLAPRGLHTVMVGDVVAIRAAVEAFDEVEVRPAS
ncbi:MAG TPA: pitrilysin family protein, partial [Acidimicrobiales bacterium]|nr:pitrilysin family protein [Acidimicrobiales bacterium]